MPLFLWKIDLFSATLLVKCFDAPCFSSAPHELFHQWDCQGRISSGEGAGKKYRPPNFLIDGILCFQKRKIQWPQGW